MRGLKNEKNNNKKTYDNVGTIWWLDDIMRRQYNKKIT